MTDKIIPRQVKICTTLKAWGSGSVSSGSTDESSVEVTFDIPEGMTQEQLTKQIFSQKEKLDVTVTVMELAKGSLPRSGYDRRRHVIKESYDSILGRKNDNGNTATARDGADEAVRGRDENERQPV